MLKLDSNGYIAYLLVNYTNSPEKYTRDLCGVIRGLWAAFFTICLMIVVACAITFVLFAWVVPFAAYGFTHAVWHEPFFTLTFALLCIAGIGTVAQIGGSKFNRWRVERLISNGHYRRKREPSFFAVWYDGFKNKYCPRVEFVDKSEDA